MLQMLFVGSIYLEREEGEYSRTLRYEEIKISSSYRTKMRAFC